jgi:tetratricopeptide (TPR) repeat protein
MSPRAKRRILLLVSVLGAAALAAGGVALLHRARVAGQATRALAAGLAAERAGDYPVALKNLSTYCARHRTDPEAVLALARARLRVPEINDRHLTTGIAYARAAADLLPGDLRPLELLLDATERADFVTERVEIAEQVLTLAPGHHDALAARSMGLARLGRTRQALEVAQRFADAFPDEVDPHRQVVLLMEALDQPRSDIRAYAERVGAAHPSDVRFGVLAAQVAMNQGDLEGAARLAENAAGAPAGTTVGVAELVQILDRLSPAHPDLASLADRVVARAMSGPLAREVSVFAAARSWKGGRPEEACRLARVAVGEGGIGGAPDDILGWCALLGASDAGGGDLLERLDARSTSGAAAWAGLVRARRSLDRGDWAMARVETERAGLSGDQSTELVKLVEFYSAHVNAEMGEWRRAADQWRDLAGRDPAWRSVRLSLMSLLRRHGQVEEAAALAVSCLRPRLPKPEAMALARCLADRLEAGHAEAAMVEAATSLVADLERQGPDDPVVLILAVRTLAASGKSADAVARTRQLASVLAQSSPAALVPALDQAEALRRADPSSADLLLRRARELPLGEGPVGLLASSGQSADEVRGALTEAVAAAPDGPARLRCQLRLAVFLESIEDPRAASCFAAVADERATDPLAQNALLESRAAWRDKDACARAIGRLRDISGETSTAWRVHEARWVLAFSPDRAGVGRAADLLGEVLRAAPHDTDARALMAEAMLLLDDRDSAISHLAAGVDAEGSGVSLYPRLIALLRRAGRAEEASRRIRMFARVPLTSPPLRRERAGLLAAEGLWDQASTDYACLDPWGSIQDTHAWAAVALRQGDKALARRLVDRIVASPEATEEMIASSADFLAADGRPEEADALLARAPASAAPERRRALRAAYLERHARRAEAEVVYLELASGGSAGALAELARFYLASNRLQDAGAAIERARAADPKDPAVLKVGGLLRLVSGDSSARGLSELASALESREESPSLIAMTRALEALERDPQDLESFGAKLEQITRDDPPFFPAWNLLASVRWQQGDAEGAVRVARGAARALPSLPAAARLGAHMLAACGHSGEALQLARHWRELAVEDPLEAEVTVARLLGADGHADEALRALEPWAPRLIAEADKTPDRLELYARVLADNRRDQEAQELLWARAQASRDWAMRFLRVGINLGNPEAAGRWLTRAEPLLAVDGEGSLALGQAWLRLARARGASGAADKARAIDFLRRAADDSACRGLAAQALGECAHASGDLVQAQHYYRIAIAELPENAPALNNLASILLGDPGTRAESISLARRAVAAGAAMRPVPKQCRSFYETLGTVLMNDGQYTEAEKAYREGLQLNPAAVDLNVGLAEAVLAQGRRQEAQVELRKLDSIELGRSDLSDGLMHRLVSIRQSLTQDVKR